MIGETGRYVCFRCRVCFHGTLQCPHCRTSMHYVGTHFRAPRRRNAKAWRQLERMSFSGSFRYGRGPVPMCGADVTRYLRAQCEMKPLTVKQERLFAKRGAPAYDGRSNRFRQGAVIVDSAD